LPTDTTFTGGKPQVEEKHMSATWIARSRIMLTALGFAVLLSACESTPRTRSDYDPAADFSAYKTFGFAADQPGNTGERYTSLIMQHLRATSRVEMEKRGYVYTDDNPDLLLDFQLLTQEKVRVDSWGGSPYWRGRYGAWGGYDVDVRQYTEGTLLVDLVDARRKQVVWQGVAQGTVTEAKLKKIDERAPVVMAAIFSEYPFRAGDGRRQTE
jgi:hypothetical protein